MVYMPYQNPFHPLCYAIFSGSLAFSAASIIEILRGAWVQGYLHTVILCSYAWELYYWLSGRSSRLVIKIS